MVCSTAPRAPWHLTTMERELRGDAEESLLKLGIRQEVQRSFTGMHNFSMTLSVISVPMGVAGSLGLGWNNGGPASCTYGWLIASLSASCIALSMVTPAALLHCMRHSLATHQLLSLQAEIISGLPSAGGPYMWASYLAGRHGGLVSWVTGWFSLLGQISDTAAVASVLINTIASMVLLSCSYSMSPAQLLGLYGGVLAIAGCVNMLSGARLAQVNALSFLWHGVLVVTLILLLPALAPTRQSFSFVFGTLYPPSSSPSGITSPSLLFLQGALYAQYCLTAYDSCSHMAEETTTANSSVPYAIICAVGGSAFAGWALVMSMLFSVQDPNNLTTGAAAGNVVSQLIYDIWMARFSSGTGAIVCIGAFAVAMMLCLISSVTGNSRMAWAFARDQGLPFSTFFRHASPKTRSPQRTVWLSVIVAFLLGLPMLQSSVAFSAVIAICTVGLAISYGLPIAARLTVGKATFTRGPVHLGRLSAPIGWLAVASVCIQVVLFCMPGSYPITPQTLNYAPIAVGVVLVGALGAWVFPVWGARHWHHGAACPTVDHNE